ncbi:MAG: hypothetical protein GX455_14020 [Phycisphaerae bacterium]|nr:hypothetical protein [Phycisphaerae bacterium]
MNDNGIDDRNQDKMKIAASVTDFPIHLVGWLCDILDGLTIRGAQVDLFVIQDT